MKSIKIAKTIKKNGLALYFVKHFFIKFSVLYKNSIIFFGINFGFINKKRKNLIIMKAKIYLIIALLFVLTNFALRAQKIVPNDVYQPGEELKYKMYYGWIKGGEAKLKLRTTYLFGQKVHHVKAVGKTVGVADRIYNVYDVYESYFDPETGLPLKHIRDVKEGDYKRYNEVIFNHETNTVKSKKSGYVDVPTNCLDVVSAFYYARRTQFDQLKEGDVLVFQTYFHDEVWPLKVRYKGLETIKLDLGKIECMKFKPVVEKGVFKDEDALSIWVTNDKNYIPVRVEMDFFVGSFRTDLIDYKKLLYPLNFK